MVIDSTFSLYDIAKAHERSETHHAVGKIVVQVPSFFLFITPKPRVE